MDAIASPPDPNATPVTQSPLAGRLHLVGVSTMYRRAVFDDDDPLAVARRLVATPVQAGLGARVGDHAYSDSTWLR